MRYSLIEEYNIQNGTTATVSLWTQGCPIRCKGCHNQHTWNFDGGKEWNEDAMRDLLDKLEKPFLKDLAILGGEPLAPQNIDDVISICKFIKEQYKDKVNIFIWSGYSFNKLQGNEIWKYADLIVVGPFVLSKKVKHNWYGSSNQKIYCTSQRVIDYIKEDAILVNNKGEKI